MKALNSLLAVLVLGSLSAPGLAGPVGSFGQTTLASSASDPDLVNPWGTSFSSTSPFWISDNGTGRATLYNSLGVKQGLVVTMPMGAEPVTGQVFNGTPSFNADLFMFASENGTIAGWRGALGTTAETLFSVNGANYKGSRSRPTRRRSTRRTSLPERSTSSDRPASLSALPTRPFRPAIGRSTCRTWAAGCT